ncbi:lysozyme C-like [Eublepharis macularius]|uniref:lysozyme n=1 Tax=Eublepharis macularius TaxID=481883 RepID=A0AA97KPS8_EUBMA|nr:lysozyme C-like [Eublepharis macularius]
MKILLFLGLFLLMVLAMPGAEGKVFERCELARVLQWHGFNGFVGRKVADWVCLVKHESNYKTDAIHDNGSNRDYGIFQINSKYWCEDGKTPESKNGCQIPCSKLLDDDIEDDICCARKIALDANGLTRWPGWVKYCQGDVDSYVKGCKLRDLENIGG